MCKGLKDWGERLKREGHAEGHAEGQALGFTKGCNETERKHALALFKNGMTSEKVSQLFEIDDHLTAQWYKEWISTTS